MIDLVASDGHSLSAHESRPDNATASVVVVQEIFGVNAHIRSVVDGYASQGYHAIAPALFDRVRPGIELGYDEAGVQEGIVLAGQVHAHALTDIGAAISHVAATGPVAVVGYCFGGSLAWTSAASLPVAAAVGYYGGQIHGMIDKTPKVPTMLHFGELDHAIPLDQVQAVSDAHPDVTVHIYDGAEHGFNCDVRASYNQPAAELALARTLEFLHANGVG